MVSFDTVYLRATLCLFIFRLGYMEIGLKTCDSTGGVRAGRHASARARIVFKRLSAKDSSVRPRMSDEFVRS